MPKTAMIVSLSASVHMCEHRAHGDICGIDTSCAHMVCSGRLERCMQMGRLPTGNRKYQIEEMWDSHHEIVRLLLVGMKHVDIAATLGVSEAMVSYTANSAVVRRQLDVMRAVRDGEAIDISKRIKGLLPRAVEVLEQTMEEGVLPQLRLAAAKDVLDRGGHPAVKGVDVRTGPAFLTRDEISEIKERARSIGLTVVPSESIVDVGRVEVPALE